MPAFWPYVPPYLVTAWYEEYNLAQGICQLLITLTDEEYQALRHSAAQAGKPVESLAHDLLAAQIQSAEPGLSSQAFMEQLYHVGIISNLPIRQPLSAAETAERTRLAKKLGHGQSLSDIVIQERGPRA